MNNQREISPAILEQAAEWMMRLSEGTLSRLELAQLQEWRASSSECESAWQRAECLLEKLGGLPPELAFPALDRPANPQRRVMLGRLATLLALAPVGWAGWQLNQRQGWTADYHSAIGQQRHLTLTDGSRLTLNTDTSIDVDFVPTQRLITLRRGEILVRTAADSRPFFVATAHGRMQALGTVFNVRELRGGTRLTVLEGRVKIDQQQRDSGGSTIVEAGHSIEFSARQFGSLATADSTMTAWTEGMLVADNMRLGEFAAELARYRAGIMRCHPAVAQVRISGAFPLDDTRRALSMLASTYPVQVDARLGGYWVTISPQT